MRERFLLEEPVVAGGEVALASTDEDETDERGDDEARESRRAEARVVRWVDGGLWEEDEFAVDDLDEDMDRAHRSGMGFRGRLNSRQRSGESGLGVSAAVLTQRDGSGSVVGGKVGRARAVEGARGQRVGGQASAITIES